MFSLTFNDLGAPITEKRDACHVVFRWLRPGHRSFQGRRQSIRSFGTIEITESQDSSRPPDSFPRTYSQSIRPRTAKPRR